MTTLQYTAQPTSPEIIKKIEREIIQEAKNEERVLKDIVKDLTQTEKDVNKAQKSLAKAEHVLETSEQKEQKTLKNVYKAENVHNIALSNVHQAQHNFELKTRSYNATADALKIKSQRVEEAMRANDEHTKDRNARLNAIRGPSAPNEASMIVPENNGVPSNNAGNTIVNNRDN